jgi:hypothetical protein
LAAGDDIVAIVRTATGECITLVHEDGDSLAHALTLAAIAPLAIERAPMRVNLVVAGDDADPADVAAAVAFLDGACSTTGQIVRVGQPGVRSQGPSCSSTNA